MSDLERQFDLGGREYRQKGATELGSECIAQANPELTI